MPMKVFGSGEGLAAAGVTASEFLLDAIGRALGASRRCRGSGNWSRVGWWSHCGSLLEAMS